MFDVANVAKISIANIFLRFINSIALVFSRNASYLCNVLSLNIKSMITILGKPVYKCEFCGKISMSKGGMTWHERCCRLNPMNMTPCTSCSHLIKSRILIKGSSGSRCPSCYRSMPATDDYGRVMYFDCRNLDGDCDGSKSYTEFKCEVTGKKMYFARKIGMLPKEKRQAIIDRCDCAIPCECEHANIVYNNE